MKKQILYVNYSSKGDIFQVFGLFLRPMNSTPVVPLPGAAEPKKKQVAGMFDRIAGQYDFLNHFLSAGIDKKWRKRAINSLRTLKPEYILDVATGTGDLALAALELQPKQIIGVDISEGMLQIGKKKIAEKKSEHIISLQYGDSENLPFEANRFDAITCAYGVRNFEHLQKGLQEMNRVLRPGGRIAILEFSHPKKFPIKQFYGFYFRYLLPHLGRVVSKDATAYTYLPESVAAFPEGTEFCSILKQCGFKDIQDQPLTFGITSLYTAQK